MTKPPRIRTPKPLPATLLKDRSPPHEIINMARYAQIYANEVESRKFAEIEGLLALRSCQTLEEQQASMVRAMDLFESLKPTDGLETMLALQMLGTHHAAMECLHRANLIDRTPEARNLAISQASKLMLLYTSQMAALDKHRSKDQQQVTVTHVHTEAGAQAIVGDSQGRETGAGDAAAARPQHIGPQAPRPARQRAFSDQAQPARAVADLTVAADLEANIPEAPLPAGVERIHPRIRERVRART